MHDVLAVLALAEPLLFERARRNVAVETAGTLTRGMTVIDARTVRSRPEPTCDVLARVDAAAAFDHVVAAIASFSATRT
jgi:inosine-uridine nucleoside N-ribohydrolase